MRIVGTRYKVLYVIASVVIIVALQRFVFTRVLPYPVEIFVGPVLEGVAVYIGTRTFRGPREPLRPRRAWWRMTAAPKASLVLAFLLCLSAAVDVLNAVTRPTELPTFAVAFVEDAALAFFYFNSRRRLQRTAKAIETAGSEHYVRD